MLGYFSLKVLAVSIKALAATFQLQTVISVSVFSSIAGNSTISFFDFESPHEITAIVSNVANAILQKYFININSVK